MLLVQKWPFFQLFFFRLYRPGKCLLRYCRTKKKLSRLSKQKVQKVEKLTFFQRVNLCFWSKNGHFSNFFFLAIVGQENVFYDILEPTNTFLSYKNEKFKKSKNWHFSKGLSHALGPKIAIFPTFFLRQYRPRKSLLRYFRTKKHLSRL